MQYFLIALGSIVLLLVILLLLTGGTVQNLVGFFVEELDDHNTPVHPVKLLQGYPSLFQNKTPAQPADTPEMPEPAAPETVKAAPAPAEPAAPDVTEELPQTTPTSEIKKPHPGKMPRAGGSPKSTTRYPAPRSTKQGTKRNPNQIYTEIAILTHKIDERRRVVDSSGHSTLYDEYFELVFETRRGETLRMVATRATFKEIPFNQEGALTYKRNRILKFKYNGGTVVDEMSSALSS